MNTDKKKMQSEKIVYQKPNRYDIYSFYSIIKIFYDPYYLPNSSVNIENNRDYDKNSVESASTFNMTSISQQASQQTDVFIHFLIKL